MKVRLWGLAHWRRMLPFTIAVVPVVWLLSFRLVAQAPSLSPSEAIMLVGSRTIDSFIGNPVHWISHWLTWAALQLPLPPVIGIRLPSLLLALLAAGLFGYMTYRWYGRRSMLVGCLLFVCSAWFLHLARLGTVDITYVTATLALLAVHVGLNDNPENTPFWYLWLLANLMLLTVPGMIWLILISAALQWRTIDGALRNLSTLHRIIGGLAFILVGTAVALGIADHPQSLWDWLGIMHPSLVLLRTLPLALGKVALAIGFWGPHRPEAWLGQLPILDFFAFAMLLVGLVFYARHWRASRTHLLASFLVIGALIASFDPTRLSLIMPLLYLIASGGIAYFLHFWLQKFPRNPIARTFGIGLVLSMVVVACSYNLAQYFIAWPHSPETAAIHQRQ